MRMSSVEEYGLRCLLQVARNGESAPVPIQVIAANEGLSPEYVAKLLRILRHGGLVSSTRGAAGGYQLTRAASEISVLDALEALDGSLLPEDWCGKHTGQLDCCVHSTRCSIGNLWRHTAALLSASLSRVSLYDLLQGPPTWIDAQVVAEATSP